MSSVLNHVWLLWDPVDCSPPGSSVHGVLQARILGWVSVSRATGSSWPRGQNLHLLVSPALAGRFFTIVPKNSFEGKPKNKHGSYLVAQIVKSLPAMQETWVRSLGREGYLEKEMATHSSILAWRIPWTEEPGGLQSMGSQRAGHDWALTLFQTTNILHCFSPSAYLVLCWTS